MAVSSWSEASPYILATGQEVMPMGGFSGTVPAPTLAGRQAAGPHRAAQVLPARRRRLRAGQGRRPRAGGPVGHLVGGKLLPHVPASDYGGRAETLYVCGSGS